MDSVWAVWKSKATGAWSALPVKDGYLSKAAQFALIRAPTKTAAIELGKFWDSLNKMEAYQED